MIGAIAGDIIGSPYEGRPIKTINFPLFTEKSEFTDDSMMTIAVADAILTGYELSRNKQKCPPSQELYKQKMVYWGRKYPDAGYGNGFYNWFQSDQQNPYNSFGNGSAMRVSPIGFAFPSIEKVLSEAEKSAAVSHNHPEGIKGAQAVAAAVFLARTGKPKKEIKAFIQKKFAYDLNRKINDIRPHYNFDVTCQGSVPEAIIAFLESRDLESAIRLAVSLGADSDTQACIAGSIAQAFYKKVPGTIKSECLKRLPKEAAAIVDKFSKIFKISS